MIHLICGRICSGKSTLAEALSRESGAVLLSCDELMTTLFPEPLGENYDAAAARAKAYLHNQAARLARSGMDVILDWGFWRRDERESVRSFYAGWGIETRWHCVEPAGEDWQRNIRARSEAVRAGATDVYELDEGLLDKMNRLYEAPAPEEIDVWHGE